MAILFNKDPLNLAYRFFNITVSMATQIPSTNVVKKRAKACFLWLALLLLSVTVNAQAAPLTLHLVNALSGKALPAQDVIIYRQKADNSWQSFRKVKTDAQGKVTLDLDGIGQGTVYRFRAQPYTTGVVYSQPVTSAGSVNFKVGKLKILLKHAANGQVIGQHKLTLYKKTPDGKLHWYKAGLTDDQGIIYFDPEPLEAGVVYVAVARNVFGNNKNIYSQWITSNTGTLTFSVSTDDKNSTDLKPPVITIISPTDNSAVSDKGFKLKARVDEANTVASVKVTVIDPVKGESTVNAQFDKGFWVYEVKPSQLTVGKKISLQVIALDDSHNEGSAMLSLNVISDQLKPVLTVESHKNLDQVSENGFLMSGTVTDNTYVKSLQASVVDPVLGTVFNGPLQISLSGHWALPIRQLSRGKNVKVTLSATDFSGNAKTQVINLMVSADAFKAVQLLNRITFGATPQLLEEVKQLGANQFIQQQLSPSTINDSQLNTVLSELGDKIGYRDVQMKQLARIRYSKKQLLEVMAWFWENHFNTYIKKVGSKRQWNKHVNIHQHALGNFRDLLEVTATSRAMIYYLDGRVNRKAEPNENYARELLELHTVGIDGGYTAEDIKEVARIFTGWTIKNGSFYFQAGQHDDAEKMALGEVFSAGQGVEDGKQLLDLLAVHPSTAHFICTKLLRTFVSDTPEQASINNCAADFLDYAHLDNQIALVLKNIFNSPEFSDSVNFHNKVKTPLEFVAGFLRQFDLHTSLYRSVLQLTSLGMGIYENPVPTGYAETGSDWINSNRYLLYTQFTSQTLFSRAYDARNYMADPVSYFKDKGYETADGIVGYLFKIGFSNDYSPLEWKTAMDVLTDNQTLEFDINSDDAEQRIRQLLSNVVNFPAYQLQ